MNSEVEKKKQEIKRRAQLKEKRRRQRQNRRLLLLVLLLVFGFGLLRMVSAISDDRRRTMVSENETGRNQSLLGEEPVKLDPWQNLSLTSPNVAVYDLQKGSFLFEKASHQRIAPASLTKIMTTLVALEEIEDLTEVAPIDVATYQQMVAQGASLAGFYGKEETTYQDLLYGTMLASGGECANSLAVNLKGSVESFEKSMNEKAKALQLKETNFLNPEGLDETGHQSSAHDLAILLATALKNEEFQRIFTTEQYKSTFTVNHPEGLAIKSTVLTKAKKYPQENFEILGGKSGTTELAGLCWSVLAQKNGRQYVVVVLGAPMVKGSDAHIQDVLAILRTL